MIPGFSDIPCWYLLLAVIVSLYQAYRGFMFQWILAKEKNEATTPSNQQTDQPTWTRSQKISLLCISDMWLYFVSTLAGFTAIFSSYHILKHVPSFTEIGAGFSALIIFLVLLGLIGVCGQLPHLMQQGKLFPWKQ